MRYGPYTKQEFYSDVLAAWNDAKNETHSDVVRSLLWGKYSWENLKSHYKECRSLYEYDFDGTGGRISYSRWVPAMQMKVSGAVRAMRNRDIHLPPKQNKHEVDFASLRCG